ncbi:MAG: hypothetical protein CMF96_08560 [Candidatus Marinimicrobia bacterium]|nr:hypothetical protein [Candidatus Neomarinimicrobiota bacterium]
MSTNRIHISSIQRDLFISILLISCIGIVVIYSASSVLRPNMSSNYHFLIRHIIWSFAGLFCGYLAFKIPLKFFKKYAVHFLIISIFLIFLGSYVNPTNDAGRWLLYENGAKSITTSDFGKLALILYCAWFLDKYRKKINNLQDTLFPFLIGVGLLLISIMNQPDMSTTIVFSMISMILLYIGGLKYKFLISLIFSGITLLSIKIYLTPYMLERIIGLLSAENDGNYQVSRALMAMGSAGFWGKGLGDGLLKKGFIPEIQGDFIFSLIGEEFGLIFELILIYMFLFLFIKSLQLAQKAYNPFSMFLVIGISINFILYVIINIGYVTQLLPTTGLALPFISYGGTHTIINFILVGLLFNVAFEVQKHGF